MAISQKQLGNVYRFDDITSSQPIMTPTDIATTRAIIFNQTTPSISVTFPNPDPLTEKPITLVNRGTVNIVVQRMTIEPGPAYQIFWDGFNWLNQAAIGVGVVTHIQDSSSIDLTGDGSPDQPLTGAVSISASAGNGIEVKPDGLFVSSGVFAGSTRIYWVDGAVGDDTYDGSFRWPMKTLNAAYDAADPQDLILLLPGNYTEDLIYSKQVRIAGFTTGYSVLSAILGSVTLFEKPFFKNLGIIGQELTDPTIDISNIDGGIFDNVNIRHAASTPLDQKVILNFGVGNTDKFDFINCNLNGTILVGEDTDISAENYSINLSGGTSNPLIIMENKYATLNSLDRSLGPVIHTRGSLFINNNPLIEKDTFNYSVTSTCSVADGVLSIRNSGLLHSDSTFGLINKSGDCPFSFDNVVRDAANDVLVGLQLRNIYAEDINSRYSPTNYVTLAEDLRSHLAGIDTALGSMQTQVETMDTVTVDLTGVGTPTSKLEASVRVSSNSNNAISVTPSGLYVNAQRVVELIVSVTGGWIADKTLYAYRVAEGFTLPANLTGSQDTIESPDNVNDVIRIFKNGTEIGNYTIVNSVGTFTFTQVIAFVAGDIITFVPDNTSYFDYISLTLRGTKI